MCHKIVLLQTTGAPNVRFRSDSGYIHHKSTIVGHVIQFQWLTNISAFGVPVMGADTSITSEAAIDPVHLRELSGAEVSITSG